MKNKAYKIKNIFLKKMLISSFIQIISLGVIIIIIRACFAQTQLNLISDDLLIKDQYTQDKIISYLLLDAEYPMELELHNIGDMKKLDDIKFIRAEKMKTLSDCTKFKMKQYLLCSQKGGKYIGISRINYDGKFLGQIIAEKKYVALHSTSASYDLIIMISIIALNFIFNMFFLFLPIKKTFQKNTSLLINLIMHRNPSKKIISYFNINEHRVIAEKFIAQRVEFKKLQLESSYHQARKHIAEQVAHDIRSPLAAINMAIADVSALPEFMRLMIKGASGRINDIANNLLMQSKNPAIKSDCNSNTSPELIYVSIQQILSEKKFEYSSAPVEFQINVEPEAFTVFSNYDPAILKRIMSNLINNSIEAMLEKSTIKLNLAVNSEGIIIDLEDNGRGIPKDVLPRIMEQGFSFGKSGGTGLGLPYAKQYLDKVGGKLTVTSKIGQGTRISISLLKAKSPAWFCESLKLKDNKASVVLLGQDPDSHALWKQKFDSHRVTLLHFEETSDFLNHCQNNQFNLYILEFDDENHEEGLNLIDDYCPRGKAVLVTDNFENKNLQNRCEKTGVKIIPKSLISYILIQ